MILLDTHVWLWWLHTPEKLSERSRTLLTITEILDNMGISIEQRQAALRAWRAGRGGT
ncbi:MAG: type II toxin-antitoxin system VapC family toxin [Symploca sp. SIO2G7]|nr:type II toxin-antitoxin system VapC family toxin [Symploca sp. SIO2G7]